MIISVIDRGKMTLNRGKELIKIDYKDLCEALKAEVPDRCKTTWKTNKIERSIAK